MHPRPQRPHRRGPGTGRPHRRGHLAAPGRPAAVEDDPSRPRPRPAPRGRPGHRGGRRRPDRAAHARARAGRGLPLRSGARHRLHRRHPLQGRPRRHRAVVLPLPDDHRVHPRAAAHPAARDQGPHRPRRLHHDWRRGAPPGGMDQARALSPRGGHPRGRPFGERSGRREPAR
ncbi:hypothetical protein SGPA1_40584 [Streptomyces misionensis JCM 4497]